jgi:hypothetical protein
VTDRHIRTAVGAIRVSVGIAGDFS